MQRNIATALPADARHIDTWINLRNVDISKLILQLVQRHGTEQDVEEVRALLHNISRIGTVQLFSYVIGGIQHCSVRLGNCRIPIIPIIKKIINRPVNDTEKDTIAAKYITCLVKDGEYKNNLEGAYNKWKTVMADAIQTLRNVADEIENYMSYLKIAKIAAPVTTVAGSAYALFANTDGIAAAVGFIAAGIATGIGAGIVCFGADFVADKFVKRTVEYSDDIIKKQEETTRHFIHLLDEYKQQTKDHLKTAAMIDEAVVRFKLHEDRVRVTIGIGDSVEEELGFVNSAEKVLNLAGNVADDALKLPLKQLKVLNGAVRVVGVVTNVVIIAIDIHTIVKTAVELSEGSTVEAANSIREAAQELESRKLPELKDAITQSLLESAKECRIPEVFET